MTDATDARHVLRALIEKTLKLCGACGGTRTIQQLVADTWHRDLGNGLGSGGASSHFETRVCPRCSALYAEYAAVLPLLDPPPTTDDENTEDLSRDEVLRSNEK